MSDRKFWGKVTRGKGSAALWGPHPTREAAIAAVRAASSMLSPLQQRRGEITSGYGEFGPSFDIRWNPIDASREPAPH